ncbi:hypothetical protein DRJ17_05985 [Candidatus Woesearchaeota archaeon]|nr:MAG: hypothetical protein DRJ17_05985 [Candidatus Woesearchaeota archaeon]
MIFKRKEKIGYKAKYLGGHSAFPKPMKCEIQLLPDHIFIPEMPLKIRYEQIENVQSMTKEKLTVMRLLLLNILAFALKKKKLYMVLTYKDEFDVRHNMVFDVKNIEEVQPAIYRRMIEAKQKTTIP